MKKWQASVMELKDSIELLESEIEELENDELSAGEAGFLYGYEAESEDDDWWGKEEALIDEKMLEVA